MLRHESGSWSHPDDPGEPSTGHPRLSVTDLEASILAAFVAGWTVLEIGTGLGVSTRALASTAKQVHTVDIDPWVHETIWPYLPDNVVTHESPDKVDRVFAVFIDGDHSTAQTARDIVTAQRCSPNVILCHDANYDEVRKAFDDGWHIIPTEHGIGVRWI